MILDSAGWRSSTMEQVGSITSSSKTKVVGRSIRHAGSIPSVGASKEDNAIGRWIVKTYPTPYEYYHRFCVHPFLGHFLILSPVMKLPLPSIPILFAMEAAVMPLSPVIITTRIPACLQTVISSLIESLGGSASPTSTHKVSE